MRCTWAGCRAKNTTVIDGWTLCPEHVREHHELMGLEDWQEAERVRAVTRSQRERAGRRRVA